MLMLKTNYDLFGVCKQNKIYNSSNHNNNIVKWSESKQLLLWRESWSPHIERHIVTLYQHACNHPATHTHTRRWGRCVYDQENIRYSTMYVHGKYHQINLIKTRLIIRTFDQQIKTQTTFDELLLLPEEEQSKQSLLGCQFSRCQSPLQG